jgi:hypothetical protein
MGGVKIIIFYFCLLITIFYAFLNAHSFQIPVFTVDVIPFEGYREVAKERLCEEKRVLIYGIKAYREAKRINCPTQLRVVGGILYISEVYTPQDVYVSPLPHPESLKRYGQTFVVFHSSYSSFYVRDLSRYLRIKAVFLTNVYDLERELPKALSIGYPLLLLPDPLLYDERAKYILRHWLRQNSEVKLVDLAHLELQHPNRIVHRVPKQKYLKTLKEVFAQPELERGRIYYVEE